MRLISTRVHGYLDYSMGFLLVIAPYLLGFAREGPETWVPVVLGLSAIAYSLFTSYELGLVRRIPMSTHLALDAGSGLLLAASPWIFGFADYVYVPHLVLGLLEIGAAAMTRNHPDTGAMRHQTPRPAM